MAKLLPAIDIATVEPLSEQQVLTALMRDLPDDAIVLHSYETLSREKRRQAKSVARLIEGECDMVILWPGKGMLVIEVKGGAIGYDNANGRWSSRDRNGDTHWIKDPFEQARKNMHVLERRIASHIGVPVVQLGLTRGYAVVFPARRIEGGLPTHIDADILCDGTKIPAIGQFVDRALALWAKDINPRAETIPFKEISKALIPSMKLVPSLAARINAEASVLHRLTEEQARFLEFVQAQTRARIWGVAGSGKTLLAVQQARRFAATNQSTLLLCYNRSLANWLRNATADDTSTFEIMTFHELCEHVTAKAGAVFREPEDPALKSEFWNQQTPELLMDYFTASGLSYDALVVDEGQDFHDSWWLALESILPDEAPVYVFYDQHQNLFNADGHASLEHWLPLRFDLPTNCRNTRSIANWCANIVSIDSKVPENAPEGIAVTAEVSGNEDRRKELVEVLISRWLSEERVLPQRIAILSPWRIERSCLADVSNICGVPLTDNVAQWQAGGGILATTIRSFKGLEAEALVMIDLPKPGSRRIFTEADFYVGCSRAKSVLHLIASEPLGRQYSAAA